MTQSRTFTLHLKNDQTITLKFSPIDATGNRLWQMFATTEALDVVDQIIGLVSPTKIAPTTSKAVKKPAVIAKSITKKKK